MPIRGNEQVVLLVDRSFVKGSKDLVKKSKCALGPNNKAADVATRCELEKVEATDVNHFNSRQIAECFDNAAVFVVDNEGAATLAVTAIAHLSLTGAKLARVGHLYDVAIRTEGLEKSNGLLCFAEGLDSITNNEGNFLDLLDAVATSENERGKCGRSEGRDSSKAALILVHLDMPSTPGLRGRKHPTTTTHVTERGLTRTVSASSANTGNTRDGTTSTP